MPKFQYFGGASSGSPTSPVKPNQSLVTSSPTGGIDRADTVLFIDARHIYRQVDRAHRQWTPAQIGFLANLVRLDYGEALDYTLGGDEARAKIQELFGSARVPRAPSGVAPEGSSPQKVPGATPATAAGTAALPIQYRDVPGLCRAAPLKEIEAQGWSLNPGRYVGVAAGETVSNEDFALIAFEPVCSTNGAVSYQPGATPQVCATSSR